MARLKINLNENDYEDFKELLHTCVNSADDLWVIDGIIAEKVLREIENNEH